MTRLQNAGVCYEYPKGVQYADVFEHAFYSLPKSMSLLLELCWAAFSLVSELCLTAPSIPVHLGPQVSFNALPDEIFSAVWRQWSCSPKTFPDQTLPPPANIPYLGRSPSPYWDSFSYTSFHLKFCFQDQHDSLKGAKMSKEQKGTICLGWTGYCIGFLYSRRKISHNI